ncbi:MAG: hypothetical protein WCG80_08010 [Spirochaetales bacterium]
MKKLKLDNGYGGFSADGKEYVIRKAKTPRPWSQIVSNGEWNFLVSQVGAGYSWRDNAGQNRVTRSFQDLVQDAMGTWFYARDLTPGATYHDVWSLTWQPTRKTPDEFEVRYGAGFARFLQRQGDIRSDLWRYAVPGAPMELAELHLTNTGLKPRRIELTSALEWELGQAPAEHREFHKLFIDTAWHAKQGALTANKHLWGFPDELGRWNNVSWPYTAFHACSAEVQSYDADKLSFLGGWGNAAAPAALEADELARNTGRIGDAIAALRTIVELEPGQTVIVVFATGAARHADAPPPLSLAQGGAQHGPGGYATSVKTPVAAEDWTALVAEHCHPEGARKAREAVHAFWDNLLDVETLSTPDDAFTLFTQRWSRYQAIACRLWAKSGPYQVSAGWGFRDQLQDSLVWLESHPERTADQIVLHAGHQFQEGDVLHWWFTIRGGGPRGTCSDDLLWLPFAVELYLEETGDEAILDRMAPWQDGGEATIREHCERALKKAFSRFSPRGIPLMGDHDWNDGLSAVGNQMKGESMWVAQFLGFILERWAPLVEKRGDPAFAKTCRGLRAGMAKALEAHAWDGAWYHAATNDNAEILGTASASEGRIFLNPQTWAVISGLAPAERQATAMASVEKELLEADGAVLLRPAYHSPRTDIGYITRYAPGLRENGGTYSHAATWAVWAWALLGNAELAWEAWARICPPKRGANPERWQAEPYVMPGNIDGPDSPLHGRAGWSWYTGSAQWMHRMAVHWLLGVRPEGGKLRVAPLVPAEWPGFRYGRPFRGGRVEIEVKRVGPGNRVRSLVQDGVLRPDGLAEAPAPGTSSSIVVEIGV